MSFAGKDLNLLIPLRALLEEANVTRAGDRVNLGQSSMSSALARLRVQFGDELLVRVGRDYELTPLARLLLPQVQMTVPLIEQALGNEAPFDPATSTRTFTLMMSDFAALEMRKTFAVALLNAPDIRIDIRPLPVAPTDSQRDLLKNDFVLAVPGIGIDGESAELFTDHYVCLVDAKNPLVKKGELSWDDFISMPQAVCDFGQAHLTPADRRLRELGFARQAHVKTSSFMPLPSVVAGTSMVAVVPNRLAVEMGPASGTIWVPAPFGKVDIIETLWWHSSHNTDPSHVWLREIILNNAPTN